jgi:protein-L-isoaspartate(D-aspartate) O-methyltransferase
MKLEKDNLYRAARNRMVKEQIMGRGISDERVLAAMQKVPRHLFVEERLQDRAYGDHAIPIGEGQSISQPYIVAFMSAALGLTGTEKVLEIGTGSAYQAVILAELAARVFSVERVARFISKGWEIINHLHYSNIVIREADGTYGWKEEAPFDAIIVTAGSPTVPTPLLDQLKIGGRMLIPVGERGAQTLQKVVKEENGVRVTPLIPCLFVPLIGAFAFAPMGAASGPLPSVAQEVQTSLPPKKIGSQSEPAAMPSHLKKANA